MPRHPPERKRLTDFEFKAKEQGFQNIAGVDEVGRGCLAGPVVAACVILLWEKDFSGVNDSKQLTLEQREEVFSIILERALSVGIGVVDPKEIDRMNILRASLKAMRLAVEDLKVCPDFLLVDGNKPIPLLTIPQQPIIKGDCLSLSVAAASIIAKVTRDRMMAGFTKEFPQFSFDEHKGYGTKQHLQELKSHGPTAIHRLSFRGVVL